MKQFNLIFLEDKLLLSSKAYGSWRDIQNEFVNYKASLDFDSLEAVKEYLLFDYKDSSSFIDLFLEDFKKRAEPTMILNLPSD